MSDTPRTEKMFHEYAETALLFQLKKSVQELERELTALQGYEQFAKEQRNEVAMKQAIIDELRRDKERLDWLDLLRDNHEMAPCWKGKNNPTGERRYDCESDMHIRAGHVALYLRDALGNVSNQGNGDCIRAAIDAAKGTP